MSKAETRVQAETSCEVPSFAAVYQDKDGREIRNIVIYRGPRKHRLEDMHVILREALLARAASILLLRRPAPNPRDLSSAEVLALHYLGVAATIAGIAHITFLCRTADGREIEIVFGRQRGGGRTPRSARNIAQAIPDPDSR